MSNLDDSTFHKLSEQQMLLVNRLCNLFEAKWKRGEPAVVEEFLVDVAEADRLAAINELLPLEVEYRARAGNSVTIQDYLQRFPDLDRTWLSELLATTHITDDSAAPDEIDIPEKLGDYRILSRIGGGGMGTVYKALHERMGRTVALKVLRPEIQRDPALLKRFDREVRVAARLSHPNIVAALDAREQDGVHFLITEYTEGTDLDALVRGTGPLSVASAVDCILQAARGLDYAHRQGVVHRDIKPANLLRNMHGVVKVLDMGLARLNASDDPTGSDLTETGMVMGTAAYMAPEQARDTHRADARSDIYSLGCTLYFLLNGRSMFSANSVIDTILSHVNQPAPALINNDTSIPPVLDTIFRRMVAKHPADRFQTTAELVAALEGLPSEILPATVRHRTTTELRNSDSPRHDFAELTQQEIAPIDATLVVNRASTSVAAQPKRRTLIIGGAISLIIVVVSIIVAMNAGTGRAAAVERQALRFNGHSSYVEVLGLAPQEGETYTFEAIVRPRNFRTSNVITWLGDDWMGLYIDDQGHWGLARRFGRESYVICAQQPAVTGEVAHVAGVYHGNDLRLFVNGKPVDTGNVAYTLYPTKAALYVGGSPPGRLNPDHDRYFDGDIHAVRITRGERYTKPFQPPTAFESDPETIVVFPFEEGRGDKVTGTGKQNWEGRIVNAVWQPTSDAPK